MKGFPTLPVGDSRPDGHASPSFRVIRGRDQLARYEQKNEQDQRIDNGDGEHADFEAAVAIIKMGAEQIAEPRRGVIEAVAEHQRGALQTKWTGADDQVEIGAG